MLLYTVQEQCNSGKEARDLSVIEFGRKTNDLATDCLPLTVLHRIDQ